MRRNPDDFRRVRTRPSRRAFLATSASALSFPATGCLEAVTGTEQRGFDSVTKWAVPAGPDASTVGYSVFARNPRALQGLASDGDSTLSRTWGDVDLQEVDLVLSIEPSEGANFPNYTVYRGSFDTDGAADRLQEAGATHVGEYHGFDCYEGLTPADFDWPEGSVGVGDGVVVRVGGLLGQVGTAEDVHRVVDASRGTIDRVTDESEPLREAASRIEPAAVSSLARTDPDTPPTGPVIQTTGILAAAAQRRPEGETAHVRFVYVYESAEGAEDEAFPAYSSWNDSARDVRAASFETDGRVVTVEYERPVERVFPGVTE